MIDCKEQNRFNEKSLFETKNDAIYKCIKWEIGDKADVFISEYYSYKRFSQSVIHKREIKFYKSDGRLEIIDRFEGRGEHNLE
jgi:hypothetical protein